MTELGLGDHRWSLSFNFPSRGQGQFCGIVGNILEGSLLVHAGRGGVLCVIGTAVTRMIGCEIKVDEVGDQLGLLGTEAGRQTKIGNSINWDVWKLIWN